MACSAAGFTPAAAPAASAATMMLMGSMVGLGNGRGRRRRDEGKRQLDVPREVVALVELVHPAIELRLLVATAAVRLEPEPNDRSVHLRGGEDDHTFKGHLFSRLQWRPGESPDRTFLSRHL